MPHSASVLLNRLLARGKFRHVQVLLKLAELGSVRRTADAIGMTQSAVTQTLAYLEDLVEMPLFERHTRGVRPTAACADLLPVARNMLLGVTEGAEVLAARQNLGRGAVRMMASNSACDGMLVQTLPGFHDRHPDIQVHLTEAEGDALMLAASRGEVDLVACRRRVVHPEGWQFHPLVEERFVVLCAPGHPLARSRAVGRAALADASWLLSPAGSVAREQFDEFASHFPHPPRVHPLVSRSPTLIGWLLRQRPVLAFVPSSFLRHLVDAGELAEVRIGEPIRLEPLGLLQRAAGQGEAAAALSRYLLDSFPLAPIREGGSRRKASVIRQ